MSDFDNGLKNVTAKTQTGKLTQFNEAKQRNREAYNQIKVNYGYANNSNKNPLQYLDGSNQEAMQANTSLPVSTADKIKRYNRSVDEFAGDTVIGIGQGVVGAGKGLLSLGGSSITGFVNGYELLSGDTDLTTTENVSGFLHEATGLNTLNNFLEGKKSDVSKTYAEQLQQIKNNPNLTEGQKFGATLKHYWDNPSEAFIDSTSSLTESVVGMGALNKVGKGVSAYNKLNTANKVAVTSGITGMGSYITQAVDDPNNVADYRTLVNAGGVGVATGLINKATANMFPDVDRVFIGAGLNQKPTSSYVGTVTKGALGELVEEVPQSNIENSIYNYETGKELFDGAGVTSAQGVVLGGTSGAMVSALTAKPRQQVNVDKEGVTEFTREQLVELATIDSDNYNPKKVMDYYINHRQMVDNDTFNHNTNKLLIDLNVVDIRYKKAINNATDEQTKQQLEQEYETFLTEKYNPTVEAYDLYMKSNTLGDTEQFINNLNQQTEQIKQASQVNQGIGLDTTTSTVTEPSTAKPSKVITNPVAKQVKSIKPVKVPTNIPQGYKFHQVNQQNNGKATLIGVMGDYSKKDTGAGSGDHFDISVYDNGKGAKAINPLVLMDRFQTAKGKNLRELIESGEYTPSAGQQYGASRDGGKRKHIGIDYDARIGREIFLNPKYQVTGITAGNNKGGYGHNVIIHFSDGVAIRLAHMNKTGVDKILQTWGSNSAQVNNQQGATNSITKPTSTTLRQSTIKQLPNGRWTSDDPVMARIIAVESMGDANADRGNTQYLGLMQMGAIERKQFGISNPFDAEQNFNGAKKYILKNVAEMEKAGIPVNATTVYLAHNQGLGGLKQIWQASQGKGNVSALVRSNMDNNGGKGKTAKEFIQYWEQRLEDNYQTFNKKFGGNYVAYNQNQVQGEIPTNNVNQTTQPLDDDSKSNTFKSLYDFINDDSQIDTSGLSEQEAQEKKEEHEKQKHHARQIVEVLRNYSQFTIEQVDKMSFLNDSQKSMLRNLIETKGFIEHNKTMEQVSKEFFNGKPAKTRRESTRGINEYIAVFDRAIRAGNALDANSYMYDLERFEHSHASKARLMEEVFTTYDISNGVQIAPDKQGNWQVISNKLSNSELTEVGGITVDNGSGRLLNQIKSESEILTQLKESYKPVLADLLDENYTPAKRVYSKVSSNIQQQQSQAQQNKKVVDNTSTQPTVNNQAVLDLERGRNDKGGLLSLSAVKQDKSNIGKQGWLAMPYNLNANPTESWQVKTPEEQVNKYIGLIKELSQDDDFVKGLIAEKGKQVKNGGVANKVVKSLLSGLPDDVIKARQYIQNFNYNADSNQSVNTSFSSYDKFDNSLAETNQDKSYVVDADVSDKTSHENVILAKTQRKDKHGVDTFSDSNPNSKKLVDAFIKRLAEERDKGQELVFPKNGVSKHLETSAPKTYAYLNQRLKDEFGYDNTQRVFEDKPTDKERSAVTKGSSKNTKTARPAMRSKVKVPKLKPSELKQKEEDYLNALNDDAGYFTSGIKNLDGINQAVEYYLNGNTEYESNKAFIDSLGLDKTLSNVLNHYIQARQYGYEDKSLNDLFNMGSEDLKALAQERLNEVDDKEIKLDEEKEIETEVFGDVTLPTQLVNNKVVLDDVLDLLQHIEDNRVSKNEKRYHLELIDGLLNYSPDYQIELIKQDSKETHDYDEKTKTMKIYLPINGGNIFELISRGLIQSTNAQVLNDLDSKDTKKLNRELDKIRDVINIYIRDNNPEFDANTTYLLSQALENNTGLITIGLSNKGVIDFLKQVKTEEKNVKTNLFRRLVRAISDFIGMTNGKETQNLYERLVELSAQASNLQNATVDRDLYKMGNEGKLTVLQNISDNDVQKELNKDFEYRNHLISAFTQQTGKGKPLASIKDVLGKLRLNLTQGLQALHSTLPTKAQREQVKDFINFHQEFVGHLQDTFRAKQKTDKGDFGYQDLKTFLAVDGEIDENVYTAMSLAVYDYIIENGNHTMNTDKEIKKLLNLEPEDDSYIPKEVREQYRYLGEPSAWSANKIGQSIIKSLGLKHNGLSNPELQSRLEMSVGQWAINAMQSADLVHIHTMKTKDHFNNIINAGGEVPQEFNAEGVVHFMSVTDAKGLNHNPLLTEIVSKNFATKGYLAEVFGFESRLTYPKLEKPTEVKLKIKGTDSVVTQKQEELLKRVQEEPVRLAKETVDSIQYLYDNFNDDLLEMFGASISEQELKYMHIDDRDGAIAGAEAKLRGLQNALGFISGLDKDEQGNYQEFYLPTYVAKNTRWHFDSNVFNFQTDKIHRAMGEYANFKTTMDTKGLSLINGKLVYDDSAFFNADGKTTDLTRFFRALGENLEGSEKFIEKQDVNKLYARGYTVDKMSSTEFIPAIVNWFNQPEVIDAVNATKVLLDKPSELKQEHINSIKKFIAMGEMGASSYRALIEYTRLVQAMEQGQEFTTYIGLGSDGINNGSAISYTLNGALDISPSFAYQVGLIMKTDEQNIDNYFDTRYDHNIGDYYESFAKQIKDYLESSKHPLIKAIQAVHKSASGRKLAKDVLIPFGYSAGIGRISQITLGRFLKDIRDAQVDLAVAYMKLQERKEDGTVTDEYFTLQMAKLDEDYNALQDNLRVMLGKDYNLPKYEEMLETSLDVKHERKLTKIYNEHMNKPLGDMLNKYADKFIVTRNKNIAMHETMYGIYQSVYQSLYDSLKLKYINKYKAEIKRKKPDLTDEQLNQEATKKFNNIGLTQQEIEEQILKPIAKLIPKVDSPFSFIHNETERESRFDAFKWVKELVNKDNIETIGYQYNEQGELQATSTHLPLLQKILESTGVFTNSAQTQGSDAYITTFTSADSKDVVINVHDADIGGIGNYTSMAIKQNEMFFKGMAQYHANLASLKGLINSINNLNDFIEQSDLSDSDKDNLKQNIYYGIYKTLSKGDRRDVLMNLSNFDGGAKEFDGFVKDNLSSPAYRDNLLTRLIDMVYYDAKQADLNKLYQLKELHAVHQYGGEDGQYYLTDADRKLIDEQLDVIEKAYSKLKSVNENISQAIDTISSTEKSSLKQLAPELLSKFNNSPKQVAKFSENVFNRLVSLNPTVKVEIVSDLNQVKDKVIRAMVEVGGAFVPEQNTLYIYPDSTEWEQSTLELINHELTHSVTAKAIDDKVVDLSLLDKIKDEITFSVFNDDLNDVVRNRLNYILGSADYQHEIIAITSSEYEIRQALKSILGVDKLNQLNKLTSDLIKVNFNERKQNQVTRNGKDRNDELLQQTNANPTGTVQGLSTANTTSQNNQRSQYADKTNLSVSSAKQAKVLGLHEQLQAVINSKVSQEVKDKAEQLLSYDNDYDVERKSLGQDASDYILSKDKIIINSFGLAGNQGALEFINRLERALKEIYPEDVTNEEVIQPKATQEDLNSFIQQLLSEKSLDKPQAPVLNYLMDRVVDLNPNLSFGFADDVNGYAYYDLNQNVIRFNRKEWLSMKANEKAGLVIHELYHSLTDLTVYKYKQNPTNLNKTQRNAYELLEQMRETTRQKLLDSNQLTNKLEYATSSINEFIAHGMSDPDVKKAIAKHTQGIKQTKTIKIKDGLRTFFNAVVDFFAEKRRDKLTATEGKAYKDFIQAVNQLETKYEKPSSQIQKSYSKYSTATDTVNAMSVTEVLKSLDATGLDENHNTHLDSMIDIIGGFYEKNETNKKKVNKTMKSLKSKPLNYGFKLSDKEAYVYAILEEISYEYLQSQAGNLTTSELNKLYDEVSKQFTSVDKLYDGFNALSKDEQALLRKKYNFVFGAKNADKPHRFMALTLASQEFRDLMNQNRQHEKKSADTWFAKLMNYLVSALNFFKDKRLGKTNKDTVDSLMFRLSQIDTQGRNRLDDAVAYAWNLAMKPLNKTNQLASTGLYKLVDLVKIERLTHWREVTKNTIALGANFTNKALLNNFVRKAHEENRTLTFTGELLNEMSATTAVKSFVERMIRHTQKLAQERNTIKTSTENTLNKLFTTDLNSKQRNSITAILLRTDANSLFNQFNKATVKKLLVDNNLRQQEINKLFSQLEQNPNGNDMIMQAKSLAHYMVTERATEHLVKSVQAIAMGVGTDYQIDYKDIDSELVNQLDVLVSLLALEYTDNKHHQQFATIMEQDEQAIFEVIALHKSLVETAKQEFVNNPLNFAKGYLPQLTNRYRSIMFANPEDVTELEKDGWVRINDDVLKQDLSDNTDSRVLMFHNDMSYRSYVSGALDMIDTSSKGTEVYNADNHEDMQRVTIEKLTRRNQRNKQHHSSYDPVQEDTAMIASYDSQGYLMNYHYEMSGFLRDNYLERNNDFAEMLGTYRSQQLYKKDIEPHQKALAQGIHADYMANYAKQPREFITIDPESNDPEIQRIWRMLPHQFREEAKALFGDNTFVIRNTVFNATFGFKAYSLADMFDKVFEDKNVFEKILTGILSTIFGDKAKAHTLKAERLIEYLTGQAKDFIVIRSGQVLLGNIISNLLLLGLSGINPLQLVKEFAFAWKNGKEYSKIEKRLAEINAEILAKGKKSELLKERNRLQQQLDKNPLKPFMEAGLMSTIVEDVEQDTDIEKYSKSIYEEKLDKIVSHVPKPIKTIFDYATLNTNTEPYKFLSEATQFSDFGAKIVLARHLMQQGKSLNEAISQAQDHFINYDIPTSRGLDYMNRVGLMMFTKFFLRFQKIMFNLLHKKLATSVAQHSIVEFMTPFQGIYEPLMFSRVGNPFELPVYTYFTSIDDALPMQLII